MVVPFRFSQPFLGACHGVPTSSFGLSALLVAGSHAIAWLVAELCQWAIFSWTQLLFRYADWLSLWLCVHSLMGLWVSGLLACPKLSSLLWFSRFLWVLFSHMVHTLCDGVTPVGSRLVCPRSERRFSVFPFPFGVVSSCCHCPWGFGHHMGQCVGGFPLTCDRRTFPFWVGFEPLSGAPLCALSLRGGFLVVLAEDESSVVLSSLQCSSLSHVLVPCLPPWPLLRALGCLWCLTLDPSGWGLSSFSRPAAAGASFTSGPC